MNKSVFSLFSLLFLYLSAAAQKQDVYFMKNNGQIVNQRDSADYIRVIQEPEAGSKLYPVKEFYASGKKKTLGYSSKIAPIRYEGICLSFYPNGKRKQIANYKEGHLLDSVYTYYPNGKLYTVFAYIFSDLPGVSDYSIKSVNDSSGKPLVVNGNGLCVFYEDNFLQVAERGTVKNGKRDGLWTGYDENVKLTFSEKYSDGQFISGESTDQTRTVTSYSHPMVQPEYKGGMKQFYRYLAQNVRYPERCVREGIQGVVALNFVVEKDGKLTGVKVVNYVDPDLAAEAVRVLQKSPLWTPGMLRGHAVRVTYNVPVSFSL